MADLVTRDNIIQLFQYFAGQADKRYILETENATATKKGGVKVGNGLQMVGESLNAALPLASTSQAGLIKIGGGLQMVGDSLNVVLSDESEYSLQPATTERLGGVKVGNGLRAEKDGTLKVTLDSGDGNWVTISERDAILAPDVASIQGALWQSVANGVPCLKFRYGDYEYNFDYDTITLLDNDAKPLNTSNKGMGYILSQAISTVSGGLWYEIQNGVPRLKIRQGSYEFGFNYNTVTSAKPLPPSPASRAR